MNYYERHLGDYAKDTGHLSQAEHGAYGLLLDRYYGGEAPIQASMAHRVARARTKDEIAAVDAVLAEFFVLDGDAWRNKRADAEIAKARTKIKAARENGARGGRPKQNPEETKEPTKPKPSGLLPGSESETKDKAHQTPHTIHQTPIQPNTHTATTPAPERATAAGRACLLLRRSGVPDANPGHPDLLALLDSGVTDDELEHAAAAAAGRGKGFAYALGTLKRQRSDAAKLTLHQGPLPAHETPRQTAAIDRVIEMSGGLLNARRKALQPETIDVQSDLPALG